MQPDAKQLEMTIGEKLRDDGIAIASDNRVDELAAARAVAIGIAVDTDGTCNADQVQRVMLERGIHLGNAAGGIFKGKQWKWTGQVTTSSRATNHARILRVWKFVGAGL